MLTSQENSTILGVFTSVENLIEKTIKDGKDTEYSAQIVILSTILGNFTRAQSYLEKATANAVLGPIAIRTYYFYTGDWQGTKSALKILTSIFKTDTSNLIRVTDPERKEMAFGESGSPLKFEEGDFYSLDATVFKLITLETIVDILKTKDYEKSEAFRKMYADLKYKTELALYNEEMGIYMNRMRSGEWSKMYGIGSMITPLAGLTYDFSRFQNILISLKMEKRFSAVNGVPTLPRSNYFFDRTFYDFNGRKAEPFSSFAGMISPVFNYLVYLGLMRMGATAQAKELATKSLKAFLYEEKQGKYPEYYMPDWQKSTAKDTENLDAAFMAILSVIDVININIFGDGLFLGNAQDTYIENIEIDKKTFTFSTKEDRTVLCLGEEPRIVFTSLVTVFGYQETDRAVTFSVSTESPCDFYIKYPIAKKTHTSNITGKVNSGKSFVYIDRTEKDANPVIINFNI